MTNQPANQNVNTGQNATPGNRSWLGWLLGCLGCGGLILLVIGLAFGYWIYANPNYNPLGDAIERYRAAQTFEQPEPVNQPEDLTSEEVAKIVAEQLALMETNPGLTAEDVAKIVADQLTTVAANPNLTAEDVAKIVAEKVAGVQTQNPVEGSEEDAGNDQVSFDPAKWYLPVGAPVDFNNPVNPPDGFPDDWSAMSKSARETWVSERIGIPVKEIWVKDGIGGYGYAMNAKSVAVAEGICAYGFTCQLHHADDNRVTFSRGHDEPIKITDGTFALEFALTDEGGICTNYYNAYVYDASQDTYLWPLGEVEGCLPIPQRYLDKVDPALGEKTREVQELVKAPVNSIGHIKDGYGLFWVYSDGLGEGSTLTCASGYACVTTTDGTSWIYAEGAGQEMTGLHGAYVINLNAFDSACEALNELNKLVVGDIAGVPVCTE